MPRKKRDDFLKELDAQVTGHQVEDQEFNLDLDFTFDTQRMKILKSRGVDGYAFSLAKSKFRVYDSLERIRPDTSFLPEAHEIRSISIKKQAKCLERLLNKPLRSVGTGYTAVIGSYPSDVRAKLIALNIMNNAIDDQISGRFKNTGRAYPLWHPLMGGFHDSLRDSDDKPLSMLIITNVSADSSQPKLEKLRDLLEKYHSIPKIVVVNGCDPVSFFLRYVRQPINYAIYVNGITEKAISIMDI